MMNSNPTSPALHQQAVDDAVLAYVQWREECMAVWSSYDRWASATAEDKETSHAAYYAALDREEAAANFYAKVIESVGDLVGTGLVAPQIEPNWGTDERPGAV